MDQEQQIEEKDEPSRAVDVRGAPHKLQVVDRAFITLITNDEFVSGAEVLTFSLRKHCISSSGNERIPIIAMVTAGVSKHSRRRLERVGCTLLDVEPIPNPYASPSASRSIVAGGDAPKCNSTSSANTPAVHVQSWVDVGFTKLHIWGPAVAGMARKVVYCDADMLVVGNINCLFDSPGVPFTAAPDVFPPDRFNAGLIVVEPHPPTFDMLCSLASSLALPSYDGGDTGFLNACWPDWHSWPSAHRLPFAYNAQRILHWFTADKQPGYWHAVEASANHTSGQAMPWGAYAASEPAGLPAGHLPSPAGYSPSAADRAVKVIHYSSSPKPWERSSTGRKGPLEMLWWDAFMEGKTSASLPFQ